MSNAIMCLRPWKEGPLWLFDDERVGLRAEPFVQNASALIDELVRMNKVKRDKEGKISLLFGPNKFPGSVELELADVEPEGRGVTYVWHEKKMDAWLCPAFYKYFQVGRAPRQLFVAATA
jgi:hypothetical protein